MKQFKTVDGAWAGEMDLEVTQTHTHTHLLMFETNLVRDVYSSRGGLAVAASTRSDNDINNNKTC